MFLTKGVSMHYPGDEGCDGAPVPPPLGPCPSTTTKNPAYATAGFNDLSKCTSVVKGLNEQLLCFTKTSIIGQAPSFDVLTLKHLRMSAQVVKI